MAGESTPLIRVLPESLVNKIAAGEVIVRPASVVKELVENALDAGATRLRVEVSNNCRDIKVTDDGAGMARADAALSLIRHATSKIADYEDLWSLATRGFRGEALASIAAVSRLEILTRQRGEEAATRVVCEGGGEPVVSAAGAPEGTSIRVQDLFFNTPARLKFMKSPGSELRQTIAIVTRQALMLPSIGFTFLNGGETILDVAPGQEWSARVGAVLGRETGANLLEVDVEYSGVRVEGFVVRPVVTRKDRSQQYFYVNGRPITNRTLSFVLQEAYRGIIMVQRFPVAVLNLVLPGSEVDINVHPTKEEVRFMREQAVTGALHRAASARLREANLIPAASLGPSSWDSEVPAQPTQQAFPFTPGPAMPGDFRPFTAPATEPRDAALALERAAADAARGTEELEALAAQHAFAPPQEVPTDPGSSCGVRPISHSVQRLTEAAHDAQSSTHFLIRDGAYPEPLGQVGLCYIVARTGGDLLLIDQHAAHERLLYMKYRENRVAPAVQPLLVPVTVDAPPEAAHFMHRLLPVFGSLGLGVEHFGGQTFLVHSVPADLPNLQPGGVLMDLVDDFESLGGVDEVEVLRDRIITRMACRAAIKAGQSLSRTEMEQLIRDLVAARLSFTCPHGRPTMIMLTRDQLDRQFKRKA